jgi:hypothetical protein
MGVTYADILNYSGAMQTSAKGWANLLAGVEESATYLQKNAIAPSSQVWQGDGQELFDAKAVQAHGVLIENTSKWDLIKQNLIYFDQDMQSWQTNLKTLVSQIENGTVPNVPNFPAGWFTVNSDGMVTIAHQFPDALSEGLVRQIDAAVKLQAQYQDMINNVVTGANQLDANTAKALAQYFPNAEFKTQTPVTKKWTMVSGFGSLWQIAQSEYGNPDLWTKIWAANPNIADPNVIPVNLQVKVPPLVSSIGPATIAHPAPATPGTTHLTQQQLNQLIEANGGQIPPGFPPSVSNPPGLAHTPATSAPASTPTPATTRQPGVRPNG